MPVLTQVASLTNHACSPNCRVAWGPRAAGGEARTLRLIAATAMEVGDEIFLSYGPVAGRMPLCDRRAALERQYCFHCRCVACEDLQRRDGALALVLPDRVEPAPATQLRKARCARGEGVTW